MFFGGETSEAVIARSATTKQSPSCAAKEIATGFALAMTRRWRIGQNIWRSLYRVTDRPVPVQIFCGLFASKLLKQCKGTQWLLEEAITSIRKWIYGDVAKMKTLSLVIALVTLIAVGGVTQSFADEYWIVTDGAGMPSVTSRPPTDSTAGIRGPYKLLRSGGKGHGNRHRVEGTVLYFRAMHYGKAVREIGASTHKASCTIMTIRASILRPGK